MDLFNKLLIVILAVTAVVFWLVVFLITVIWPGQLLSFIGDWVAYLNVRGHYWQLMLGSGFLTVLVALVSGALLILELSSRESETIQLAQVSGGTASITTSAVVERLSQEVEQVPGVYQARLKVSPQDKAMNVLVELVVDSTVDYAALTESVCAVVRQAVEGKMGIQLKDAPRVVIQQSRRPIRSTTVEERVNQ